MADGLFWQPAVALFIFAGAVAKYCDEHVWVSVCLSVCEDISGTTRAIFTKFLCMLTTAVAR